MQFWKWIKVIAVAAVVLLAIVYGFMPRAVPVDIVKTSRGPMRVTVGEEGRSRVKERFVISAPIAGFMHRIQLDVGDPVKRGQTVVELEPLRSAVLDPRSRAAAEAGVSAAEAALRAAEENARARRADAEYARENFERIKRLYDDGYASKSDLDQADTAAKRAVADLQAAESAAQVSRFELDRARTALRYAADEGTKDHGRLVAVRTPVSGRVLTVHRESEGVVNPGDPLLDIGNPANLEVKVEVLSADAVRIKRGTPVLFERWGGGPPLTGKVRVVEPAGFTKISSLGVEEQRVIVIADITSSPAERKGLGDGYRVDASFIIWEKEDVLQVPAGALFRKGEEWALFVVKDRKAHLRPVEVGQRNGLTAEILSGLSEGEDVISHPDDTIQDGVRVRPRE